jgi:predicted transcriptional regulator
VSNIQVLFVVLNETDCLNDILAGFVDVGVTGATILDSQGMANIIVKNDKQPIFLYGHLKALMQDALPYNKTIFTVLKNEELVDKAVAVVQNVIGDVPKPGVGFMFSFPISKTYPMGIVE